ncbi:MAG TPA: ATP-binding protein [Arenibaculum sp.]|nr:ATP-binding protein [Arenibaculum sp.]
MTEAHHLATLAQDVVGDTTSEPAFKRIAQLAAHLCGASIASVCIDGGRSWSRARIGCDKRKGGSAAGLCSRVTSTSSTLIVRDTHADPQFRDDPAIANVPWVRFYAGAPLNTPDGHCVGTLCVMDTEPRHDIGDDIAEQLEHLAALVIEHLERRRNEIALARSLAETKLRNRALRGIATGEPLAETLDRLVQGIEALRPGMLGSVLLLDPERRTLRTIAAPSLPGFFVEGIDGVAVGPDSGICAAAAFRREEVVVADLAALPGWTTYRNLAHRAGLAACWSRPITDRRGQVLGTFGFYYREAREPDEDDIAIIETAISLALIAIERDRSEREREHLTTGLESALASTEAVRMELAKANLRLRDAIEAIPEGFVLLDEEGRFLLWNGRYEEMYAEIADRLEVGARFETVLKAGIERGQYPEAVGREADWMAERLAYHASRDGCMEQRLPNGRWLCIEERRTAEGGSVGIRIDITDLKARQAELEQAKNAAEAASRAKSEFLAHMSHEFRTPLNAILGFSEMIREEYFGPHQYPQYRGYAEDIHGSGEHLLKLLNDVLELAKLDSGQLDIGRESVDLRPVVEECLLMMHDAAAAKDLDLFSNVAPGLPPVKGDRARLRKMIANLVSNAIKYTEPGGRVGIDARQEDGGIALRIADTGIGMTPDEIRIALEPFRQVGSPFDRSQPGTGLGLSLTQRLTMLHDGDFRIESAPGEGTTVTMVLPTWSQRETAAAPVAD